MIHGFVSRRREPDEVRPLRAVPPFPLHRVPWVLRLARWRVRGAVYRDRLWRDMSLSLTLGGVLLVLVLESMRNSRFTMLLLVLVAAIALIPWLRARALTRDQRVRTVRLIAQETLSERTVLFYVLFHFHNAMVAALAEVGNGVVRTRGRRPDVILEFPRLLAQHLFDVLGFRSREALLNFLRFPIDGLLAAMSSYEHAVAEETTARQTRDPEQIAAALQTVADARARMHRIYERFTLTRHAELVSDGLRIVTMPGTSRAIGALCMTLQSLVGTQDDSRLGATLRKAIDRPNPSRRCQILLELVDAARGHSMIELADLRRWYEEGCQCSDYCGTKSLDPTIRQEVARNLLELVKTRFAISSGVARRDLAVATSGYSSTVLACLEGLKPLIRVVYLVQTDRYHARDNGLMAARLEERQIRTEVIGRGELRRQAKRCAVQIALFGFEAINPRGDILHPRSNPHLITAALRSLAATPLIVAVGDRWKVCAFDADAYDPAFITVHQGHGFTHVVTDHAAHDASSLDLSCCMT
jgi:hypothetical protein